MLVAPPDVVTDRRVLLGVAAMADRNELEKARNSVHRFRSRIW